MADIYDGYMGIGIDEDGHLILEKDVIIDNVTFDLNSNGHLVESDS